MSNPPVLPIYPGVWREAKGVRLYLLGREHRIIHVASRHDIGDKAPIATALGIIGSRLPRDQVRIALVADGAEWTWDVMRRHFPDGEEIVDYYHCAEQVHATARAQFGEGSLEGHEWTEAVLTRLALSELGHTLGRLKRMPTTQPGGRGGDPHARRVPRRPNRALRLRRTPSARVASRQRRDRVREQADVSCPAEALRGVVVGGQRQRHASHPLRPLQRHLPSRLRRLHRHADRQAP